MSALAYIIASGRSTNTQRFDIAQMHNIERWFTENVVSESIWILERPEFMELLKFARKGDTLVICSVQSLGRCSFELYDAFKALQTKEVNVLSLLEGFDLSSRSGATFLKTLTTLAELDRTITRHESRQRK
ncbi:recombinase family protein [Pseudomonas sp. WS 5071]|uniref:recombinase family protein n=1 Tax=Pseudomonas sp. WS 5071 TaxID=2717479 RepID=UPI0014755336|nr:recombinase family protein [Pseudomonas sp. WS 5071]NMY76592.1 recombinase family protein [Pseudomonas sp. WS 5071]